MRRSGPKNIELFPLQVLLFLAALGLLLAACTFDYGDTGDSEKGKADIIMEDIEYVRMRGGDPQVRFKAEYAERWEDRQTMEIKNFSFEQMEDNGDTVDAEGRAGTAVVQLESGDVSLGDGVRINIDSEDIIILTARLEWKDKEKTLSAGDEDAVDIQRSDGTSFTGIGFYADTRNRTWRFLGEVMGTYVETDEDDEGSKETGEAGADKTPAEYSVSRPVERQTGRQAEQGIPAPDEPQILPEEILPSFVEEK